MTPPFKPICPALVDEAKPAIEASLAKYSSLEYMLPKN